VTLVLSFAFLRVFGIVVDDAIVVGDSIYTEQASGKPGVEGTARSRQWY
jgi:multidrug efflux pump subunit AcrB